MAPGRLRSIRIGRPRPGGAQVERVGVDDDLAASRREDPDERPDRGQVERAERSAGDDERLVLTDAIDVSDGAELGAIDAAHRDADDLVPVVLAPGQLLLGPDDRLEVGAAEGVGRVPRSDLVEPDPPSRPVGDRLG